MRGNDAPSGRGCRVIQVHTVLEATGWRNKVDGLHQGPAYTERFAAAAEGRRIALELRGAHVVHDVDGTVVEHHRYGSAHVRRWVDPAQYRS